MKFLSTNLIRNLVSFADSQFTLMRFFPLLMYNDALELHKVPPLGPSA